MRLLLAHQNFPGQFRDLSGALCDRGHELKAIGNSNRPHDPRIEVLRYEVDKPERSGIHGLTGELDEWIRRAERVAEQAMQLRQRGWAPDLILAHPGWGETLLLRQVFPSSPMVVWPELWLQPEHLGLHASALTVQQMQYLRVKNWLVDGAMSDAALAILPTDYQAQTFPERWRCKIAVVHEGVPHGFVELGRLQQLQINESITLSPDVPVVTFISRNLEPMRGFPTFMRALPELQQRNRKIHVVIVGGNEVSYSAAPSDGRSWMQVMLEEVGHKLDMDRVHILERIPHEQLLKLYRRSNLHVYLSKAFVLSWSLLEIMACGSPVLAEQNAMTEELIEPGVNGQLWDPSSEILAEAIANAIDDPEQLERWGVSARQLITDQYLQQNCLNRLEALLHRLTLVF
jgi:glycosyltransferase involved in cell wall biosynthesis